MKKGIATFTLDYGHCPPWLFERMIKLGREMTQVLISEYGPDEFIKRLSDPVWFQSLGTVLAFDWNASGLTTILTAALKEAIRGQERDLGVFICGGKGKTSRKTPEQILYWGERLNLPVPQAQNLVYNSKMAAKVDSSLVQDGFQIYHHSFLFSKNGAWTVIQQGMNIKNVTARRYHWYSEDLNDLIVEPHSGIATQVKESVVLDLTSRKSDKTRQTATKLVKSGFKQLMSDIKLVRKHNSNLSQMVALKSSQDELVLLNLAHHEFKHHPVETEEFWDSPYLNKILAKLSNNQPENFEKLLATEGVGPKTIRALSLVSEVIYGAKPSYEDPARYSFAHGGKDATPYPVDRPTYDQTINILQEVVQKSKISPLEKEQALRRLNEQAKQKSNQPIALR